MSSERKRAATGAGSSLKRQDPRAIGRERRHAHARLDVGLHQSTYTSPLPAPDDLDRYARYVPDAAERLLAVGEREQAHRHQTESELVALDAVLMPRYFEGQRRSHLVGLTLGLSYLAVMALAIVKGYPFVGVGGTTFGIAAVIWATRRDPSELRDAYRAAADEWASSEDAGLWDATAGDGL